MYTDMIQIENDFFVAEIASHGAELKAFSGKRSGRKYLYDGTGSWKRSAPVLFPSIGSLAEGCYVYGGKEYAMPPHGFARDMDFTVQTMQKDMVSFLLTSSEETAAYFPFAFALTITYRLTEQGIETTWQVTNHDERTMYFSIGAHPGFALLPGTQLSDYQLLFDREIPVETRRVMGRYLTEEKELVAPVCRQLQLTPQLLEKDALVLEDTGVEKLTLLCEKADYRLEILFPDFPVVAVWSDPHTIEEAQFLCLEPWCGINALCGDQKADISQKARITALERGKSWQRSYTVCVNE
ncbi:MAG: aldose 1-epimerase family protein [Ruminococcaceae bacterium]|nr:aldose 1-epimerase family protein [Oscillospiraceae bacterium]